MQFLSWAGNGVLLAMQLIQTAHSIANNRITIPQRSKCKTSWWERLIRTMRGAAEMYILVYIDYYNKDCEMEGGNNHCDSGSISGGSDEEERQGALAIKGIG